MTEITVFTASYNYGHLLHRVYEGLCSQTLQNFEWLIVDDCSNDDTQKIVSSWIQNNPPFNIRYYKQKENRGKMAAMNKGVQMATFPLFLLIDADDCLLPKALESFTKRWESLDTEVQETLAALVALCNDQNGELVGTPFPHDPLICDYYEMKFKYHITGDKCEMFRTQALKEYPYYEIDRHVIHSATYFDMSEKYKFYCFNDILRTYYRQEEGRTTLSVRTKKLRFIKGRQFYAEARINKYFDRIPSIKFKIFTYISYIRYSSHLGMSFSESLGHIHKIRRKLICSLIAPVGFLVIFQDKIRKRV
ncbi:glycosyltransferase family 2 protein [Oceanispirochaeta crateris]|uniref:Glycosyltransferase family 2 protein n=1 Tax=Oceanispirochaeta crateris TaxID=2518645 RepID=A0A5C1QFR2_9SPIO|nr:glycosyltransferase family 2 protein [Oceanispirochaeta crateris]QEN06993.1 glycosyltransferase family 2 protein [Oceanispirochaeta crateris]